VLDFNGFGDVVFIILILLTFGTVLYDAYLKIEDFWKPFSLNLLMLDIGKVNNKFGIETHKIHALNIIYQKESRLGPCLLLMLLLKHLLETTIIY